MRIGVLNNLRTGRSNAQVTRVLGLLKRHPDIVHVETDSAGVVPEALAELARQDVDLLVVNGGDGTLQHALTEVLGNGVFGERRPLIAPLRGGRTNTTALDVRGHRKPVSGLAALIAARDAGRLEERVVERAVLRVASGPLEPVRYGMFFGVGLIHRAIELVHRVLPQGRSRGVLGSSLVTAGLIARAIRGDKSGVLTPDKLQIRLDGELHPRGEFYLTIVSTQKQLFARMRPFWGQGPGNVRLTAVTSDARHMARAAPGCLRGRPGRVVTESNGYTSRNGKHLELRMDCGFTVDGEMVAPQPDRVVSITAEDTVRFVRA